MEKRKCKTLLLPIYEPKVREVVFWNPDKDYVFKEMVNKIGEGFISTSGGVRNPALHTLKHLYILSSESINVGDHYWDGRGFHIRDEKTVLITYYQKLIATTDTSFRYECKGCSSEEITSSYECKCMNVPQVDESFIDMFVKENGKIEELEVEYVKLCTQTGQPCGMTCFSEKVCNENINPKLKNNTIQVIKHLVENEPLYTKRDMVKFGKWAKNYKSSTNVEEAFKKYVELENL
jgi:hypothetical protein